MKTCVVKLYNLSKHKRVVIEKAFKQYTLSYSRLLKVAHENLDKIESECVYKNKVSTKNVAAFLSRYVDGHMHSSMKDSLILDVASAITSYIELSQEDKNTSFPFCRNFRDKELRYLEALDELSNSVDLETENAARDKMALSLKGEYMPIYFARADGTTRNRNFGILYDQKNNRFYVSLYLLHNESKYKKPVTGNLKLTEVHKNGQVLSQKKRPSSFIICPLEFGKYQEEFLKKALEEPITIRTAFLSKKNDEYFLHISFNFEPKEKIETETIMGIDRGIKKLIAYTIVDLEGNVITQDYFSGREYEEFQDKLFKMQKEWQKAGRNEIKKYSRVNEGFVHIIANHIVEKALEYKSRVVLEDLKGLSKGGFKKKTGNKYLDKLLNRKLGRNPYSKLNKILEYKLPSVGLPKPFLVNAKYTSQACPVCGTYGRENRKTQEKFKCISCGHEMNADLNASWNIAKRFIFIQSQKSKKSSTSDSEKTPGG